MILYNIIEKISTKIIKRKPPLSPAPRHFNAPHQSRSGRRFIPASSQKAAKLPSSAPNTSQPYLPPFSMYSSKLIAFSYQTVRNTAYIIDYLPVSCHLYFLRRVHFLPVTSNQCNGLLHKSRHSAYFLNGVKRRYAQPHRTCFQCPSAFVRKRRAMQPRTDAYA